MSTHRTSIANRLRDLLKAEMDGSQPTKYYTNIYDNVSTKILHFNDIKDFPFISIVKSLENVENQPSGFRWNFLNLYFRIYVRGEDTYDEDLEKVISDVKTFIDTNENFEYTITKPDGSSSTHKGTEMIVTTIGTDEGLLAPDAMGEIQVRVRYEDCNALFRT